MTVYDSILKSQGSCEGTLGWHDWALSHKMEHCGAEMKHCDTKIEHCDVPIEHFTSQWNWDVTAWVCWQNEHYYAEWSGIIVHENTVMTPQGSTGTLQCLHLFVSPLCRLRQRKRSHIEPPICVSQVSLSITKLLRGKQSDRREGLF